MGERSCTARPTRKPHEMALAVHVAEMHAQAELPNRVAAFTRVALESAILSQGIAPLPVAAHAALAVFALLLSSAQLVMPHAHVCTQQDAPGRGWGYQQGPRHPTPR